MEIPKNEKKLEFFTNLYEEARTALEETYEKLDRHFAQYSGDGSVDVSGEDISELTPSDLKTPMVRNITYELIESQTTTYIPTPKCESPTKSDRTARCAMAAEKMLTSLRNKLPVEELNDLDERYTYVYGGSVWLVEWNEAIKTPTSSGGIRLSCLSPRHFVGQPYIYRIEDMEYLFLTFTTTREEIVRKYGVSFEVTEETVNEETGDDKTATVYVCYYKNEEGDICQYIWSSDVELYDGEDYYSRKTKICKKCGKREGDCECEKPEFETRDDEYEELDSDIILSDGVTVIPALTQKLDENGLPMYKEEAVATGGGEFEMDSATGLVLPKLTEIQEAVTEPTKIPFYKPKSFPVVIRKNTSKEDSVLGQSDCEFIRPQQQAINKIESRIVRKLLKASVTPVIPEDANVSVTNAVFGEVIRVRPGESRDYGVVDTTPNVSLDMQEAERLYDHAKKVLGVSASFQGHSDSSAKSGVAIQTQAAQSAGRLDSKRVMKNAAWANIDRIIFELLLAFCDEERTVTYIDEFGDVQEVKFSRYDYLVQDKDGEWYYDDEYLFSCDASADISSERTLLWQENRMNFKEGVYGDPADPKTQLAFWINMESAHYPFAHKQVERVRRLIREQNQLASMQEQIDALAKERELLLRENAASKNFGQKMLDIAEGERVDIQNHNEYEKYLRG